MARRQEIIDTLRKNYGNMFNLRHATAALGLKDTRAAAKFLEGVPYCKIGKQKMYMAIDVGRRIHDRMQGE